MNLEVYKLLERVRKEKPVVHHLTNWVTIYDCAQIVKSLGASPVMAHAKEEAADMAGIASALVLNIGTLTPEFVDAMKVAAQSANKKGIPVVLDVCGAGATPLRDKKCSELLTEVKIDIIKGNASEIARVSGEDVRTKGVDSGEVTSDIRDIVKRSAKKFNSTVVITGKEDYVADPKTVYKIKNGHQMMTYVVGTGCMAASVIGAFAAVERDLAYASAAGLACFGIAAECAAQRSDGPMSFKDKLFDCLFSLDKDTVKKLVKIE